MVHKKVIAVSSLEMLPIYKIGGKFYFRDMRLGEYRNIKDPSDRMPIDSVPISKLQTPSRGDSKRVYG